MELLLLGTGSARGWPEPGCPCASCSTATALRTARAPSAALVDDVLLLDGSDDVERAAARAGRSLAAVRRVLLSGGQDRGAPLGELVRSLAAAASVEVLGPPGALAAYEPLSRADPRVRLVPVRAGDHLAADDHALRVIAQGPGIAWSITGQDGTHLLYAPGEGFPAEQPGPAAPQHGYDVVLLGLGSTAPGAAAGRRGGTHALAQLRSAGAVTPSTQVLAIGYGHDAGMPDSLVAPLRSWGVELPTDGTTLAVRREQAPGPGGPQGRTLVLGGVRSGKSALAEQLLAASPQVTYVATGGSREDDGEWQHRVAAHVARRPAWWSTVETTEVAACLLDAAAPLLIDCLGTWLTARLDHHGVWDGAPTTAVDEDIAQLAAAWRAATVPVVAVSNEVGSGVVPATPSGRLFRDLLGRLNAAIAAESETVLLVVAGIAVPLRSPPPT